MNVPKAQSLRSGDVVLEAARRRDRKNTGRKGRGQPAQCKEAAAPGKAPEGCSDVGVCSANCSPSSLAEAFHMPLGSLWKSSLLRRTSTKCPSLCCVQDINMLCLVVFTERFACIKTRYRCQLWSMAVFFILVH